VRDLEGKTFVVTGANTGIGRATAEALALRGGHVVFAGRSPDRTLPVIEELRGRDPKVSATFLRLDLGSLAQIAESAAELLETEKRIDVLILNAGLAGHQGQTEDGFEIQFGVNHVGHYLFTRLLLDRLEESRPSRVVVVSSRNHLQAETIDWDAVQKPTATTLGLHEYNVSKLANVLFAKELARRVDGKGITTYSLNPGQVASDVWRRIPKPIAWLWKKRMLTVEQGAETSIYCATAPELAGETGHYYQRSKREKNNPVADDLELARELWERSEAWVADYL
jgi:NAD(P)-dependent dehydrogenase (short-subunit alcohol dehydrogenase family)